MNLETLIVTVYCWIDDFMKENLQERGLREGGFQPKLSDSEVISIEIIGEYLGRKMDTAIYPYFRRHWLKVFPQPPNRLNLPKQATHR